MQNKIPSTLIEAHQQAQVVQDVLLDYGIENRIVVISDTALYLDVKVKLGPNSRFVQDWHFYLVFGTNKAYFIDSHGYKSIALEY